MVVRRQLEPCADCSTNWWHGIAICFVADTLDKHFVTDTLDRHFGQTLWDRYVHTAFTDCSVLQVGVWFHKGQQAR